MPFILTECFNQDDVLEEYFGIHYVCNHLEPQLQVTSEVHINRNDIPCISVNNAPHSNRKHNKLIIHDSKCLLKHNMVG